MEGKCGPRTRKPRLRPRAARYPAGVTATTKMAETAAARDRIRQKYRYTSSPCGSVVGVKTGGKTNMNAALVTESPRPLRHRGRWASLDHLGIVLFGLLAYVPVLATSPGRVVADTKSYLTID